MIKLFLPVYYLVRYLRRGSIDPSKVRITVEFTDFDEAMKFEYTVLGDKEFYDLVGPAGLTSHSHGAFDWTRWFKVMGVEIGIRRPEHYRRRPLTMFDTEW